MQTIYADGGCRGNGTADGEMYGSWIRDVQKMEWREYGHGTNNRAEYLTLIDALKDAQAHGVDRVIVYMDSQLIVAQVNGEWKVKEASLKPLRDEAAALLKELKGSLRWVRRDVIFEKLGH